MRRLQRAQIVLGPHKKVVRKHAELLQAFFSQSFERTGGALHEGSRVTLNCGGLFWGQGSGGCKSLTRAGGTIFMAPFSSRFITIPAFREMARDT